MHGIGNHSRTHFIIKTMSYLRSKRIRSIVALATLLVFVVNPILVFGTVCNCESDEAVVSDCCSSASPKSEAPKSCCSDAEQCCCCCTAPSRTHSQCDCTFNCDCDEPAPANHPLAPTSKSENEVKTSSVLVNQFSGQSYLLPEFDCTCRRSTNSANRFTTSAQVCAILSRFTC